MTDDAFREGARAYDPQDLCPECGRQSVLFASDFKKFGKHKIRACQTCRKVFENGEPVSSLTVFKEPENPIV